MASAILSLGFYLLAELVIGWRNLMVVLFAVGLATQVLFMCEVFSVPLNAYLVLSIAAQPRFISHLLNSRKFSLRRLDIKIVAYFTALFGLAMIFYFNDYGSADCEDLAPMFLAFQLLESFVGIFLVKDSYRNNLLLDTIRLDPVVSHEEKEVQTDRMENGDELSGSQDEGDIRQVMDTNTNYPPKPIYTNIPMRDQSSAVVTRVHSKQILFNTIYVLRLITARGLDWRRLLQNVLLECCGAYLLVGVFFTINDFNAIISMIAFIVIDIALALIMYSQRYQLTHNRVVHFGVIAQFVGFAICFASLKSNFVENIGLALCCAGWSFSYAANEIGNQQRMVGKYKFLEGVVRVLRGEVLLLLAVTASFAVLTYFDNAILTFICGIPLLTVLTLANLTKRAPCDFRRVMVSE